MPQPPVIYDWEINKNFNQQYRNPFDEPTLISWLEDFCRQLDCPPPDPFDGIEYFKRLGAWETQMLVVKKIRYAINAERKKQSEKEKTK